MSNIVDDKWDQNSTISQQNRGLFKSGKYSKIYSILIAIAIVVIGVLVWRSVMKIEKERNDLREEVQKLRWAQRFETTVIHRNTDLTYEYPTVGIPIAGNTYNYTLVKPNDLAKFDQVVNDLFKPYNDTDCEFVRIGDPNDGGYVLCKNFLAQSVALINLGVRGALQEGFGCQFTTLLNIPNYLYDCTNDIEPQCPTNNNQNFFSLICVGDRRQKINGHMFYKLDDIIKDRHLTKKHIILKMDTDGGEYPAFKGFPIEYLDYIDQIVMEVHFDSVNPDYWGNLDIYKSLMDKFVPVNYHQNNYGCYPPEIRKLRKIKTNAYEVCLVNKKLITLKSNTRSFAVHPVNTPCAPHLPECPS